MKRLLLTICAVVCFARVSNAQYPTAYGSDADEPPPFEVYALASAMQTVDATPTLVIHNPAPGQNLGFTPSGSASGSRVGLVWRHANLGLIADLGFHKYSDRTGSTTLAPLMLGFRVYSDERFRTSVFGEGLAGAYRWTERSATVNFTTVKGIVAAGGGMDIRLTRSLVFRVGEIQLMIAGARAGPLLTGSVSSGLVFRFGRP
jgi:hypothetical protein